MKIPLKPPRINELMSALSKHPERLKDVITCAASQKGGYVHWDKFRHLAPPEGLSAEEAWLGLKLARAGLYQELPFADRKGKVFCFALPECILHQLHLVEGHAVKLVENAAAILSTDWHDTYLVNSLIEEAITSSQLEGASTTRRDAETMLRTHRKPADVSEQMIFNNYQAMQFMLQMGQENLTVEIILELQRILTEKTLENSESVCGKLRTDDDIHVWDHRDGTVLHTPSLAKELKNRLNKLCDFANNQREKYFIPPLVKAIILHFMLAYDHPFVDGNGRTARALFYWSLLKNQQYKLFEFISISAIIKQAPTQYAKAYLYTETDDNDLTYFLEHQLEIIIKAIKYVDHYLGKQINEIKSLEFLLESKKTDYKKLNYRQIGLLRHALKHPDHHYSIEEHRLSHRVTYDTARNDLLKLSQLKLLSKDQIGKAFIFSVPVDLKAKLGA